MSFTDPSRSPSPPSGGASEHRPTAAPGAEPENPGSLEARVRGLVCSEQGLTGRLDEDVELLERQHGEQVYAELLHQLAHLRFTPREAREHWERILDQRRAIQERLTSVVDLRVPLINYFTSVAPLLRNPKIIEMHLFEQAQDSVYLDALTGARNYRFFSDFLPVEVARSAQYNAPLSLVMVDVDHFKRYNDRFGHEAGNDALKAVARLLHTRIRKVDVLARYGGEEFALVLPSTPKNAAGQVAERLREAIAKHGFSGTAQHVAGPLTVSLGIATFPADAADSTELVRNADAALYTAKESGRNIVSYFGESHRSFRRISVTLNGRLCLDDGKFETLTTVNVSTGGLLVRTEHRPDQDSIVRCLLDVPGSDREIRVTGRVVYSGFTHQGYIEVGLHTLEMSAADRWALSQYLQHVESGETAPVPEPE